MKKFRHIVEGYPAFRLPADLREGVTSDEIVTVTIESEKRFDTGETVIERRFAWSSGHLDLVHEREIVWP